MIGLIAKDALAEHVIPVKANDVAGGLERPPRGAILSVFGKGTNGKEMFLGLLPYGVVSRNPQKTFGDMISAQESEPIAANTTIPEALKKLRVSSSEALPVLDENAAFLGAISQRSILDALLKRERELIKKARDFRQVVQDDKRRRYETVRRLEQVNQAFKKLLGALARPPGVDMFQKGIEALAAVSEARYAAVSFLEDGTPTRVPISTGTPPGSAEQAAEFERQRACLLEFMLRSNRILNVAEVPHYLRKQGFEPVSEVIRSFLAVPIARDSVVFGSVYVCDRMDGTPFTDDDEVMVASYANGLALALSQARESVQRRRAERERDMLAKLGLQLASADTLQKLGEVVRTVTEEFWGWDAFSLSARRGGRGKLLTHFEVDYASGEKRLVPSGGLAEFADVKEVPETAADELHVKSVNQSELDNTLLAGESVLINRSPDTPGPSLPRFGDKSRPSSSLLYAPTRANGQVVGVVSVQSYSPQRFTESDRRLLQRLADVVGPALLRCIAERRSAAFSALGYRLSMAESPQVAAQIIVEVADELLGWDSCSVYLYDSDTNISVNLLHMDVLKGKRVLVQPYRTYGAPGILPQKTIDEGPQLILRNAPEFDLSQAAPFGDEARPSASLMFVPLRIGHRTTGIVSIQSYELNAYDEADLAMLQALADHCSGALERFRLQQAFIDKGASQPAKPTPRRKSGAK